MEINNLKGKPISIIGHSSPDIDSILSGILLERLLKYLGVDAKFSILDDKIDSEIEIVLNRMHIDWTCFKVEKLRENIILVDHHETPYDGNILVIVDHHKTLKTIECEYYLNSPSASTTVHIYNLMEELNYPISKEDAKCIAAGIYTDTCSLKTSKAGEKDKLIVKELIEKFNLNEKELYLNGLLLRDLPSMSIDEISLNGMKNYNFSGKEVTSTYIRTDYLSNFLNIEEEVVERLRQEISKRNLDLWVYIITIIEEEKTLEILINSNGVVESKIHNGLLSRGKDIIPQIEKQYLSIN